MSPMHLPSRFVPSRGVMDFLRWTAVIAGSVTVLGLFLAPASVWPGILLSMTMVMSLAVGAGLFLALQYVSHAGWSVAIRRIPEAMISAFPWALGLLVVTFFGIHSLYEWSHAEVVAADPILSGKSGWLNTPFFVVRSLVYVGVWWYLARRIVMFSHRQDSDRTVDLMRHNRRRSAIFIVVFSFTFTLASMDWIMSIEPHWYSTIFGVYNFSGLFLSTLAAIAILAIVLKRQGVFRDVLTPEHLHQLGKLMFAFSTFWMYIWFSQYLLIWYANIPEEVVYFTRRQSGGWLLFTITNVVFNWVIPFVVLLPRWTKRHEGLLLRVSVIVLVGRWIDLTWMIVPGLHPAGPEVFIWEVAPVVAGAAMFVKATFRALARTAPVPVNDPLLVESLPHAA